MKGISIKSQEEIELMREAGRILAITHEEMRKALKPGMTTYDIDKLGEEVIRSYHCEPSFLNYQGYPASVCVSVNDEVVHGIPHKEHFLDEGDIVSLDAGVIYKGYHSDAARTYGIGEIDDDAKKLIEVTRQSFFEGIKFAKAGNHLNDISAAIQKYAESFGFGVVRDLVGHGIGSHLHEDPEIPNFARKRKGILLQPGMTLAIEPMITEGSYEVVWLDDDWTVMTEDGGWAAHYENTIVITDGKPEILTLTEEEAAEAGYKVKTDKVMMHSNGKTIIVGGERGFMKLISDSETGKILGAHLMCERATDMISEFTSAMAGGLTVGEMAGVMRPHPTFNEAISELFETAKDGVSIHTAPQNR